MSTLFQTMGVLPPPPKKKGIRESEWEIQGTRQMKKNVGIVAGIWRNMYRLWILPKYCDVGQTDIAGQSDSILEWFTFF